MSKKRWAQLMKRIVSSPLFLKSTSRRVYAPSGCESGAVPAWHGGVFVIPGNSVEVRQGAGAVVQGCDFSNWKQAAIIATAIGTPATRRRLLKEVLFEPGVIETLFAARHRVQPIRIGLIRKGLSKAAIVQEPPS